jgi:hypothetical protein
LDGRCPGAAPSAVAAILLLAALSWLPVTRAAAAGPARVVVWPDSTSLVSLPRETRRVVDDINVDLGTLPFVSLVADDAESEALWRQWRKCINDPRYDCGDMQLGNWLTCQYAVVVAVASDGGVKAPSYRSVARILDMRNATKRTVRTAGMSPLLDQQANELAWAVAQALSPHGTVLREADRAYHRTRVDLGARVGVQLGDTLVNRYPTPVIRFVVTQVWADSCDADPIEGWNAAKPGTELSLRVRRATIWGQ